ncbi:MAG: flavin reductase family protein [Rhodospirillaceae bacterium]|jgi:flavin reductase (DIM6/NTAB) family NADH-FMN oxidoreductase RutF|nr:flavin reductase family protein [Rhodospirillaceae bacterium]MBT7248909.1 flavin reductase family protein [Rhodospirillaceae bacterium]MBT7512100.1 flavin reductase family protein [Rhodospirillaceae bacterium]
MFYKTTDPHGLKFNPLKALISPRPIGWISTVSTDGVENLAPYSFFNGVSDSPPMVMFCPFGTHAEGGDKDSLKNVHETGEFVCNMADWNLREEMNVSASSTARSVDEFDLAGLERAPSELVKPSRVKDSPAHFECRHVQTVTLPSTKPGGVNSLVIGEVIGIHIDERIIEDGLIDMAAYRPIARLGYFDYTVVDEVFTMPRPGKADPDTPQVMVKT